MRSSGIPATLGALVCLLFSLVGASASASDTHYQDVIIGERAFGLGGAFTALATDASATFYNPAGMVIHDRSTFTLNASIYGIFRRTWFGGSRIDGQVSDKSDHDVVYFPTSISSLWLVYKGRPSGLYRMTIGVSLYTLTQKNRSQRLELDNVRIPVLNSSVSDLVLDMKTYSRFIRDEDTVYRVAFSYAVKLHREWSIGVSLVSYIRLLERFEERSGSGSALIPGNSQPLPASFHNLLKLSMTHISLSGAIGVLWRSRFGLRIGLNIDFANVRIWGRSDVLEDFQNWGALFTQSASRINNTRSFRPVFKMPFKFTLGLAYEKPKSWAVAIDVRLYTPVGDHSVLKGPRKIPDSWNGTQTQWDSLVQKVETDFSVEKKFTVNVSVGGEVYLHPNVPLRLGFYTNLTNQKAFDLQSNAIDSDLNVFGVTAMLGYEGERTSLMLGLNYSFAKGRFLSFNEQGRVGAKQWQQGVLVVVSNSYRFK